MKLPRKNMILAGIGILVLLLVYITFFHKNGSEVFVGEESIGIIKGRSVTAEYIVETLETQLKGTVGSEVKINEVITVKGVHIGGSREKDVCTVEYLLPKIRNMITYKVDAALIMIDGGVVAVLATETEANQVLDAVKEPYLPEEGVNATTNWVEDVVVKKDFVASDEILSEADATTLLQTTTTVTQSYTVKSGDVLYIIAQENDTTAEAILALNAGMTMQTTIRPGELLNVPAKKPMLSVKTVETQVLTTVEPKTYEYRSDATKPTSYQKVVQQGRAGQKQSTIQITRINGFVTEEKEVSKEILEEPVTEIIVRGTM